MFYIAIKAILITKQVEIIDRKKFTKQVLDDNVEIFIVHITFLSKMAI